MGRDYRRAEARHGVESGRVRMRFQPVLLIVVMVAIGTPGDEVASSQTATGGVSYPPFFTAIDLHPSVFTYSAAISISGDQQVGWGAGPTTGGNNHALLWRGSAASVIDLHPDDFTNSVALGISDGHEVGYGSGAATSGLTHSLLWSGSSTTVVDLHPKEFIESYGYGISGSQQVGYGSLGKPSDPSHPDDSGPFHALLWRGTAASVVDLHPGGYVSSSRALAISGDQQVGWGTVPVPGGNDHALVWRGSADKIVDLHPGELSESRAVGISGGQQVGYGRVLSIGPPPTYALVWRGSAASVVKPGVVRVFATNGTEQVGDSADWASGTPDHHAMLWSGGTAVDLHAFLPPGFASSTATGIDPNGDIVGYADGHAILWKRNADALPVPAPPHDQSAAPHGLTTARALLISGDDVGIVLTDPQGRRSGQDPLHHVSYHDIPGAGYRGEVFDVANVTELQVLDQAVGRYALDVFGRGHFKVDVSTWGALGQWLTHSFEGTAVPGTSSRFTFPGDTIPFADFHASLKIYTSSDAFEAKGVFTLGPGREISPTTQDVTIGVKSHFSATIPAGFFRHIGPVFVFKGVIDDVAINAILAPAGANGFTFTIAGTKVAKIEGARAATPWPWFTPNAPNPDSPIKIDVAIGDNGGSALVKAEYAR